MSLQRVRGPKRLAAIMAEQNFRASLGIQDPAAAAAVGPSSCGVKDKMKKYMKDERQRVDQYINGYYLRQKYGIQDPHREMMPDYRELDEGRQKKKLKLALQVRKDLDEPGYECMPEPLVNKLLELPTLHGMDVTYGEYETQPWPEACGTIQANGKIKCLGDGCGFEGCCSDFAAHIKRIDQAPSRRVWLLDYGLSLKDLAQLSGVPDLHTANCIYCDSMERPMEVDTAPPPPPAAAAAAAAAATAGRGPAAAAGGDSEAAAAATGGGVPAAVTVARPQAAAAAAAGGAGSSQAGNTASRKRRRSPAWDWDPLLACSTCPAAFHRGCYLVATQEHVEPDGDDTWQCLSCRHGADCAQRGCPWCTQHQPHNRGFTMQQLLQEVQQEWEAEMAAAVAAAAAADAAAATAAAAAGTGLAVSAPMTPAAGGATAAAAAARGAGRSVRPSQAPFRSPDSSQPDVVDLVSDDMQQPSGGEDHSQDAQKEGLLTPPKAPGKLLLDDATGPAGGKGQAEGRVGPQRRIPTLQVKQQQQQPTQLAQQQQQEQQQQEQQQEQLPQWQLPGGVAGAAAAAAAAAAGGGGGVPPPAPEVATTPGTAAAVAAGGGGGGVGRLSLDGVQLPKWQGLAEARVVLVDVLRHMGLSFKCRQLLWRGLLRLEQKPPSERAVADFRSSYEFLQDCVASKGEAGAAEGFAETLDALLAGLAKLVGP